MTMHKPPQAMTLFDLIARTWVLDTDVRHVLFNGAGTSVVAVLGDGRMAFFLSMTPNTPKAAFGSRLTPDAPVFAPGPSRCHCPWSAKSLLRGLMSCCVGLANRDLPFLTPIAVHCGGPRGVGRPCASQPRRPMPLRRWPPHRAMAAF